MAKMLGYEYVNLTPEAVETRRKDLDRAGSRGYLLPIILLSTVFVIRAISLGFPDSKAPKKPYGLTVLLRRLSWRLNDTVYSEFGPLHVQVLGLFYVSTLLYLIVRGTGNDYMHVTKAFGHVAVSQFPIHYLLSIKHPQSPVTLATGLTHERLNSYHRFLGRIIHTLLATHVTLYLKFFVDKGLLIKRLGDWDVRYGVMAFWTLNILGALALPIVRQKAYHKMFYRSHAMLSALLLVIVWLHVPYTRKYVGQAAFLWISNGALRKAKMGEMAKVSCKQVGGRLVEVTAVLNGGMTWDDWVPGMHGYICQDGLGPRTPFTVVSCYQEGAQIIMSFVVRNLGGPMTSYLAKSAEQNRALTIEIEGPYGEAIEYMPDVLERAGEPTLIVAGGVGATYAFPIYLALTEKRKNASEVKLLWIVKSVADARWGLELLRGKTNRNVHVYVTQGKDEEKAAAAYKLPGIEVYTVGGRPNLAEAVEAFLKPPEKTYQSITAMVCGPGALSADLRKALDKYVLAGRKIHWYEEQFGFGGP